MNLFEDAKQTELPEAQVKWNKLWDMYGFGQLATTDDKSFVLCDYESGVNGEGHSGWFFNTENAEGKETICKYLSALEQVLPAHLYDNLYKAFQSYGTEKEEILCEQADQYFYEHEQEVIEYLQNVANKLEL